MLTFTAYAWLTTLFATLVLAIIKNVSPFGLIAPIQTLKGYVMQMVAVVAIAALCWFRLFDWGLLFGLGYMWGCLGVNLPE